LLGFASPGRSLGARCANVSAALAPRGRLAVGEHLDEQLLALVRACQNGARRQTRIDRSRQAPRLG
jgi:hypothetical protein